MSAAACQVIDDALNALTSQFHSLLDEDEDVLLGLKPPKGLLLQDDDDECKEPDSPKSFSSNNDDDYFNFSSPHRRTSSSLWSSLPKLDTIVDNDGDDCEFYERNALLFPSTPRTPPKSVGLYASFSPGFQSPESMWQYSNNFSARTTRTVDAVFGERKSNNITNQQEVTVTAGAAPWGCNNNNQHQNLPAAPSLEDIPGIGNASNSSIHFDDGPPSVICYRTARSNSFGSLTSSSWGSTTSCGSFNNHQIDIDDDEVSLLADDPDEDDDEVLPPSTYDVLVNLLDDIDKDAAATASNSNSCVEK